MDWMQIGSLVLGIAMLVFIAPRAIHQLKHSPKGSNKDWIHAMLVLAVVAVFVWALMKIV